MSTLGTLKSELAGDLKRSNLTNEIAEAISEAIRYHQTDNFFFKRNYTATFTTVADQAWYDGDDDADIPLFVNFKRILVTISNQDYTLTRLKLDQFEALLDGATSSGTPTNYAYGNRSLGLYVPPSSSSWTVTMIGNAAVAAPASDAEADNPWMVEGYQLIRCRALARLMKFKTRQFDYARSFEQEWVQERANLRRQTGRLIGSNVITPSTF